MMKRILIIFFAIFCQMTVFAQDLIVTTDNDSINCKVNKVDQDNVYYTIASKSSVIALVNVKTCLYNYYKQRLPVVPVTAPEQNESEKESAGKEDNEYFKRFRFAISGGPGYRTYSVGDGLTSNSKDYYSKLKLGYQIECDATYFFSAKRGAGLKFSYFNTSNSIDNNIWLFNNGFLSQGKFAEDIMILFAGPVFSTRISTPGSINSFLFNVSVGYIYYKDKIVSISDYAITGNTAGFTIDLNYDRVISKRLSLGVLVSITNGTLSKVTQTSSSGSQSFYWNEGLTRIDLGIGLRF